MRLFIITILLLATACGTAPDELTPPPEPPAAPPVEEHESAAAEVGEEKTSPTPLRRTGPIVELVSVSEGSDDLYLVTADIRADVIATSWWLSDGTQLGHGPIAEIELADGWHRLIVVAQTEGGDFARDSWDLSIP